MYDGFRHKQKIKNNPLEAEGGKLKEKGREVTPEQENISLTLIQKLMWTLSHIIPDTDARTCMSKHPHLQKDGSLHYANL